MKKTNNAQKTALYFFLQLMGALGVVFLAHLFFLSANHLPLFNDKIIVTYIINFLLAVVIFLSLFFLRKKYNDQLGFLFLFGSFFKFVVFFIFFLPIYKADGNISRLEFFAFFVPYTVCLIIETVSLIKLLNLPKKPT
ncbi:MAG: hypothetical protein P8K77_09955 [Polaribacter sp.]|nr:hypothetical protein [Polaribacter sp.]